MAASSLCRLTPAAWEAVILVFCCWKEPLSVGVALACSGLYCFIMIHGNTFLSKAMSESSFWGNTKALQLPNMYALFFILYNTGTWGCVSNLEYRHD